MVCLVCSLGFLFLLIKVFFGVWPFLRIQVYSLCFLVLLLGCFFFLMAFPKVRFFLLFFKYVLGFLSKSKCYIEESGKE